MSNIVFIATSIDGFISAPDGNLDWLSYVPFPDGEDGGFADFISRVDAIVMGRVTFETVAGFGHGWHYPVPGIVLSSTLNSAPAEFESHVEFASGTPQEIVELATERGFNNLYIDGGRTVQNFLGADLIDELIITEIPILLGGGDRLFGELGRQLGFELIGTEVISNQVIQKHYRRNRSPAMSALGR
jgi:dihydrofolate reductase